MIRSESFIVESWLVYVSLNYRLMKLRSEFDLFQFELDEEGYILSGR